MGNSFIPYGRQCIDEADEQAVLIALRSDFITQGPILEDFERELAHFVGAKYCIAVSSATAALHLAVLALNLRAGEGITSPNTFVASPNSMLYAGIEPVFADIDQISHNIAPSEVERVINTKTRLIMPVHFAGLPADMAELAKLAMSCGARVIEDASHAIGSEYLGSGRVGSCHYSDMTVFSFHAVKTMTAGEGGAITTNNEVYYENLKMLRSHGITRETSRMTQAPGPWYYEMQTLGFNYRMTEVQAALGLSQLRKLHKFMERREAIIARYVQELSDLHWLTLPSQQMQQKICYHLFVVKIDFKAIRHSRSDLMRNLADKGIGTQVHYIPVHLQPYYKERFGTKPGDFPHAESYYESCLSIPLHQSMSDGDIDRVIAALRALA